MFTLDITTLDGQQTVELPSGWHEVSYTYYKERIAPFAQQEEDVVKTNVQLVCSMLGINASKANVMEFSAILGKAQAGDKPFMTVGDWENANDAMKFLQDSEYDQDNNADVGLVLLAALARGPEEVTDIEFARRLKEWQDINMDAILSATFFFLLFNHTFKKDIQHFSTELTKRANRLLPNITLDGLRYLLGYAPQVYLQSLLRKAQS